MENSGTYSVVHFAAASWKSEHFLRHLKKDLELAHRISKRIKVVEIRETTREILAK